MVTKTKKAVLDTGILEVIPAEAHTETVVEDMIANIGGAYTEERDLVNQLLGQSEAFRAIAKFADVVSLSKLHFIKDNKMYRALSGKKGIGPDGEEIADVGTWEGFLQAMGLSKSKVDEDLLNLKVFGEEALDSLTRIGAGYRQLRQYRRLPEDEKIALLEAAKSGDKDTFIDIAEELISKHTNEKEILKTQVKELEEDAKAVSRIIETKNAKLDEQDKVIHRLQNKTADWHPRVFEINMETSRIGSEGLQAIDRMEELREAILNEDFGEAEQEKALEAMAVVYFDACEHMLQRTMEMMAACNNVFIGYKDRARPLFNQADAAPSETAH